MAIAESLIERGDDFVKCNIIRLQGVILGKLVGTRINDGVSVQPL